MAFFFSKRATLRATMQFIEEQYRIDMRVPDDEPLTKEDLFWLRRHVVDEARKNLINALGPSRYIH